MAPNVFHIGVEEKVSVTVFDAGKPVTVKLYLQDYPHRRKTFSAVQAVLPPQPGEMNNVSMHAANTSTQLTDMYLCSCMLHLTCKTHY